LQAEDREESRLVNNTGNINVEMCGSRSPQLFAEAFTDMFSWFPFATSNTMSE